MGMAPREASLDYEGLQAHWRSEHADLASQLDGLRSYVQNHAVLEHGRPLFPYVGFDACSELEWDSLEAMDAAFASEHYQRAVVADEHSLIDKSRFLLLLSERRVLQNGEPGTDAVTLLTYLPRDARSTTEELFAALEQSIHGAVIGSFVGRQHVGREGCGGRAERVLVPPRKLVLHVVRGCVERGGGHIDVVPLGFAEGPKGVGRDPG